MVSLDGVLAGSLVASVSGLSRFAQQEGPSLEGLHHIVHFRVDCIFSLSDGNFLRALCWCRGLFVRDCWKVRHYWHLLERNSSWD